MTDTVTPTTRSAKTEMPMLPCPAHAIGGDKDQPVLAAVAPSDQAVAGKGDQQPEADVDHDVDHAFHAMLARLTGGISPVALSLAYLDWASHLATAPQRQMEVVKDAMEGAGQLTQAALHLASPDQRPWSLIAPKPQDRRFKAPEWETPPFNLLAQAFLLGEQWWHNTTTGVRGVSPQDEAIVEFSVRQVLDMLAPSNFVATNPEVLNKAFQSGGENFVFGWQNWCRDVMRALHPEKPPVGKPDFVVGKTLATSRGKIVYQQRTDRTDPVRADHRQGPSRADPDRAGLDHEVLHSRSVAA